jgi:hypothetical protein
LGGEKVLRLEGAILTVFQFGHIEDDGVGVELRSRVSVYRARCVMLELGGRESGRGLRRMVPANARRSVILQVFERSADTLAVRFAYPVVTSYQSRQRY